MADCFPQLVSWNPGPGLGLFIEMSANMPSEAKTPLYYITTYAYVLMVIVAFIFNSLLLATFFKGKTTFKKLVFYIFSGQLALANVISSFSNALTTFPVMLWMNEDSATRFVSSGISKSGVFLMHLSTQLIPFTLLTIAFHRFIIFIKPHWNVFKGTSLWTILSISWLISISVALVLTSFGCSFNYDPDLHYFQHVCVNISSTQAAQWLSLVLFVEQLGFPALDLLVYVVISIYLFRSYKSFKGKNYKTEAFLLIPSVLLFVIYETSALTVLFAYNHPVSHAFAYSLKRITCLADMMAASLTPVVIYVTNADVRQEFRLMVLFKPSTKTVSVLAVRPSEIKVSLASDSKRTLVSRPSSH